MVIRFDEIFKSAKIRAKIWRKKSTLKNQLARVVRANDFFDWPGPEILDAATLFSKHLTFYFFKKLPAMKPRFFWRDKKRIL